MGSSEYAALATRDARFVRRAAARYHELCADDALAGPHVIASFVAAMRERGLTFAGRPQCRSLRPYFVTPGQVAKLREAVAALSSAFDVLDRRALRDPQLAFDLGLSPAERALMAVDPGYEGGAVVSRFDMFFDLEPSAIEYNADSPAGVSYEAGQAELMARTPVFERFASEFGISHLAGDRALREALLAVWAEFRHNVMPQRPALPTVAIVDLPNASTTAEFQLVARDLLAHGVGAMIVSPDELSFDGQALRARGAEIDLVYRRLLVAEFLARYDLTHPLAQAYVQRKVCVASSFRCKIAHKKYALAAMCDPRNAGWFDERQRAAIADLIPLTLALTSDGARDAALHERADWVLKPNDAYGGVDVVLGSELDDAAWERALDDALGAGYVVQRRVAPRVEEFPVFDPDAPERGWRLETVLADCNPFVFRGALGGLLARLSTEPIVNVTRGGQAIPTFVISPTAHSTAAAVA